MSTIVRRLRVSADKIGWGMRATGPFATIRGGRCIKLWLSRPDHAEVQLRSGPILEFNYPGQFPATLMAFGDYIDPEFDFLKRVGRPNWTIIDVGAAIGQFSLFAAMSLPRATIHAFEPSSANIETFQRNIVRNGVANVVTVHHAALSDRQEMGRFETEPKTWMSHLVAADDDDTPTEMVPVDRLDETLESLNLSHIDVLKINVAGFEPAVLKGAMPCFADGKVDILIVLLGLPSLKIYQDIAELGYRFFYYHPPSFTLFEVTSFDADSVLAHRPWPARHIIAIRAAAVDTIVGDKSKIQELKKARRAGGVVKFSGRLVPGR
ncbi:FkbM family methyltransferase [Devosia rhodophyticola]|uniref:FkbM family methyltransferase n=1 Tax=Devosia rhodophyticola TaxID=3026423 RepID=A0ABY7YYC3_9HYPH|nr:FkbM family methyltransferase [Devosia rhodophyticola]WDR06244.1 FkbM family methyltransferase [Devosia rhodophyticola]